MSKKGRQSAPDPVAAEGQLQPVFQGSHLESLSQKGSLVIGPLAFKGPALDLFQLSLLPWV